MLRAITRSSSVHRKSVKNLTRIDTHSTRESKFFSNFPSHFSHDIDLSKNEKENKKSRRVEKSMAAHVVNTPNLFLLLTVGPFDKNLFRCNDQQNCSIVASTSQFGDPCPNTHKYLEAHYRCISGK